MEEVSHQLHHHQKEYLIDIQHLVWQHTHWPISHAAQSLLFLTCKLSLVWLLAMATVLISLSIDSTTESHPSSNCSWHAASPCNCFCMPASALHRYKTSFYHPTHPSMILISFYLSAAWVSTICVLYSHFLVLLQLLLMWINFGCPTIPGYPLGQILGCPDTKTPSGSLPLPPLNMQRRSWLINKSWKSQGIWCWLESGHPTFCHLVPRYCIMIA